MFTCFIGPDAKITSFLAVSFRHSTVSSTGDKLYLTKKKKKKIHPTTCTENLAKYYGDVRFQREGDYACSSQMGGVNSRQDGNADAAVAL